MHKIHKIPAYWKAPTHIKAFTTLACGGYSQDEYSGDFLYGLNLAQHVGDLYENVNKNRMDLIQDIKIPIVWLEQIHSTYCVDLDNHKYFSATGIENINIKADASFCSSGKFACAVLTADCLPLLVTNLQGSAYMAIHAGWRGLAQGIVEKSLEYFIDKTHTKAQEILVWLAPAISPLAFEVGDEVVDIFMQKAQNSEKVITENSFKLNNNYKKCADLYNLARIRLSRLNILPQNITGGEFCTYFDLRFYSYRRSNKTGRMVSVIYSAF
jgi:YfiH family protein